jgi:ABC-type tungstate transport system substrate-binding protein
MNYKQIFYNTLFLSVVIQIVTLIIEVYSLFIKVPSDYALIRQLLGLEVSVQIIEGLFYAWLVFYINDVTDITPKRYIDWSITTPTMLITFILYLIYSNHREFGDTSKLNYLQLIIDNSSNITYILILNWLMLIFGYLGEINILPTITGVILGFIPFILYYLIIYINYVKNNTGFNLFMYFFIFWSLYGVAALFPYYMKNSFYNILDLFSKNFFGLFLSYSVIMAKN